jgi:hypothetical protein
VGCRGRRPGRRTACGRGRGHARAERPPHQPLGLRVLWVPGEHLPDVRDRLAGATRVQQHPGQVQPQRYIVRIRLDGGGETGDDRIGVHKSCSLDGGRHTGDVPSPQPAQASPVTEHRITFRVRDATRKEVFPRRNGAWTRAADTQSRVSR